ncbi:DUF1566 domain-containing protein [Ottowia testudinis]|uniref:DUF1566 domain-containing protein n=1 Tax=Ottowia testudinis TaxID=2816950 RepID=A0A975CFJ2_9BURK|nr:DUF1566 domain-containing protein [Ottowia testudinis]QTD45280.1 DUF1566 domain-containing protein [Ottowia testudinis]
MSNAIWQTLGGGARHAAWVVLALGGQGAAAAVCGGGGYPHLPQGPFVDAGDGLVRHLPSQTVWKRCAEGQRWVRDSCIGDAQMWTAPAAAGRATAVNASAPGTENAGQTSWRLPRLHELRWLVEPGCGEPAINQTQFPRTPSQPFWTETPFVDGDAATDAAWTVDFARGQAQGTDRRALAALRLVRVATGREIGAADVSTPLAPAKPSTRAPAHPSGVRPGGAPPISDPIVIVNPAPPTGGLPVAMLVPPAICPR